MGEGDWWREDARWIELASRRGWVLRTRFTIALAILPALSAIVAVSPLSTTSTAAVAARLTPRVGAQLSTASCSGFLPSGSVAGMAATPDDQGYWITSRSGFVVDCGDAVNFGSLTVLPTPHVGVVASADGMGYYLVASDGGVFAFGDAAFQGSTGSIVLNKPVVGMAFDPATGGYWLVASDGGIFSYDAPFFGLHGRDPTQQARGRHGRRPCHERLLAGGSRRRDLLPSTRRSSARWGEPTSTSPWSGWPATLP